jgi:transcriptional regulator with XRE-family HTH domain
MLSERSSHKVDPEEQRLLASAAKQLLSVSGCTQAAIAAEAGYSGQIFSNLLCGRSVSHRAAAAVLNVLQRHTGIDWRKLVEERRAEIEQWKAEISRTFVDLQNLSSGRPGQTGEKEMLVRLRQLTPGQRSSVLRLIDEFTQPLPRPRLPPVPQPTLFGNQEAT